MRCSATAARGYNWDFTTEVQHQLRPGVSMTGGYYRNWFGSFLVTDNTLVTPADFNPFCITAPIDARLPGGGGYQVCGLYDVDAGEVRPGQQRRSRSRTTSGSCSASTTSSTSTLNARLGSGLQFGGGVDTGRSVNDACFNVDSPGAVGRQPARQLVAGGGRNAVHADAVYRHDHQRPANLPNRHAVQRPDAVEGVRHATRCRATSS